MRHFIWVYTICGDKIGIQRKNTILFRNYNMGPLEIYSGPSQFYSVKPEGRIQLTTSIKRNLNIIQHHKNFEKELKILCTKSQREREHMPV